MSEWIGEILDPRTDRAVFTQIAVVVTTWVVVGVAVRRNRDLLHFVSGIALMALAWRGLRAVH